MASVCAICQSAGTELVFEDPEEYNDHIKRSHNPVPFVAPSEPAKETAETKAEADEETEIRLQLVGEALDSIQQRLVNAFNRIETLETSNAGYVAKIEALEAEVATLKAPPAPPA